MTKSTGKKASLQPNEVNEFPASYKDAEGWACDEYNDEDHQNFVAYQLDQIFGADEYDELNTATAADLEGTDEIGQMLGYGKTVWEGRSVTEGQDDRYGEVDQDVESDFYLGSLEVNLHVDHRCSSLWSNCYE